MTTVTMRAWDKLTNSVKWTYQQRGLLVRARLYSMLLVVARDIHCADWLDDLFVLTKGNIEKLGGVGEDGVGAIVLR